MRADGSKKPGFGKQGYYLNPGCVLPYSQQRMRELVQLAGLNSLPVLDVDGTGMVSDDYQPNHPTGAAQMAKARNARLAWFSATQAAARLGGRQCGDRPQPDVRPRHGNRGFGWGDKQMNQDKSSPYYLGAWWPNAQPAFFFRPAKVKQPYRTVEFDPRYRLPLYRPFSTMRSSAATTGITTI